MKSKKLLASLVGLVLMMSMVSFTLAQELTDVSIVAGTTSEDVMGIVDVGASNVIGGFISSIGNYYERFVNFGGIKVWKDSETSLIQDFTLVAIPANEEVDLNSIIENGICEVSENVDINGVTGIWTTNNIKTLLSAPDMQTPMIYVTDFVTMKNGTIVTGGDAAGLIYTADGTEPTNAELTSAFGAGIGTATSSIWNGVKIVRFTKNGGLDYIVDLDNDGVWNFNDIENSGFSVDAIDGQSLLLAPAGTYDLYGLI